jgi:hypothetical protein
MKDFSVYTLRVMRARLSAEKRRVFAAEHLIC